MDTKDDKPQQREPAWLTYPDVKTIRANPIPRQDSSWINEFRDRRDKDIGYEDANGKKAERATHPHLHMTLCSKPMQLKDSDRFPGFAVFNAARALFEKKGADVLAHLDPLDKKLLGNFEGYELMDTDAKWYLANCLRCGDKESERVGKTIFTPNGRYANSLPHLLRAIANVHKRVTLPKIETELQKEFMRIILRISMHAHCIINGRVLRQKPAPGDKYEESEPPYLFGIFPQRDMHCRPDFETKIVRALDYATLDMPEFAKRSTVAEFAWVVAEWLSRQPNSRINSGAAALFFKADQHEHWRAHFWKMKIRLADTAEATVKPLNDLLPEAAIKDIPKVKLKIEKKAEVSSKSGTTTKFSVYDTHRAANHQLHGINWIAWLGRTALYTYPELDPYRAPFDTSTAALAGLYENPAEFEDAACHWAYLFCAGSPVSSAAKDDDLPRDAAPFINTLRHSYAIYLNEANRLCHVGPFHPDFRNIATATTSALNIQLPAWAWLWSRAQAHVKLPLGKDFVREVPERQPLYQDVITPEDDQPLPLYWLLQLDRLTGYSRTGPTPFQVPEPPEGKLEDAVPHPEPLPGVIEKRVLSQARFLESTSQHAPVIKKLQFIRTLLAIYRKWLKSRMEANEEIHAMFLFQEALLEAAAQDTDKRRQFLQSEATQAQTLQWVQWGERLWRAQAYLAAFRLINPRTSPAATYARSTLLPHYATMVRTGTAAPEEVLRKALVRHEEKEGGPGALSTLKSFWEEIVGDLLGIAKPPGQKEREQYTEFIEALVAQRRLDKKSKNTVRHSKSSWLFSGRVVMPVFITEEETSLVTSQATDLHAAILEAALHRFILPLSVYASLRCPHFGLVYQGGLTRSQLLRQPEPGREAREHAMEIDKQAKKMNKQATAVPAVLYDKGVPVLQRITEAWKHIVATINPALDAKTPVDDASISLMEALCEQLPPTHPFVAKVGPQILSCRREIHLRQKLEFFLSTSRDKRPGGGRYLTPQALLSLQGDLQLLIDTGNLAEDPAEQLVQFLDEELKGEFTALEATVKALQGSDLPGAAQLRKAYDKRRESRLQPVLQPGKREPEHLSLVPLPAADDPTKRKRTQPMQEELAVVGERIAGLFGN